GGHHHGAAPSALSTMSLQGTAQQTTAWLLAAVFLALAVWWLARGFDAARAPVPASVRPASADPTSADRAGNAGGGLGLLCHGAMALVMAVMFALMA
ncbi:DUF5134 domain-containing protein, partial [Streptomyces nanshensis]|uniref:DUF5134 domain-containing protein n=1 Tax=Streptomyces nanshensis TaxID=518642 RepID=UPI001C0BC3D7